MMPAAQTRTRPDVRYVSFTPASSDLCETAMSAGHKRTKIGKSFTLSHRSAPVNGAPTDTPELQKYRATFGRHAASPTTQAEHATSGLHQPPRLLLVCDSSA